MHRTETCPPGTTTVRSCGVAALAGVAVLAGMLAGMLGVVLGVVLGAALGVAALGVAALGDVLLGRAEGRG